MTLDQALTTLGITRPYLRTSATAEADLQAWKDGALKTAWKECAKKHHPDREGGNEVEFKKAQAAYDYLKGIKTRGRKKPSTPKPPPPPVSPFEEQPIMDGLLEALRAMAAARAAREAWGARGPRETAPPPMGRRGHAGGAGSYRTEVHTPESVVARTLDEVFSELLGPNTSVVIAIQRNDEPMPKAPPPTSSSLPRGYHGPPLEGMSPTSDVWSQRMGSFFGRYKTAKTEEAHEPAERVNLGRLFRGRGGRGRY